MERAENVGDVVTADHKVLGEGCESRNNHRYAVVVQDLASHRIQSYPFKPKTSQETRKSLQTFLEPTRKPKVIYTDNFLEFGKACEDLSWNHSTSTPHRSETNGIAGEQCAELRKELLQYCCNQVWMKNGGRIPWNATAICEIYKISCLMGRHTMKGGSEIPFNGPVFPFGAMVEHHPIFAQNQSRLQPFGPEILPGIFLGYALHTEGIWKNDFQSVSGDLIPRHHVEPRVKLNVPREQSFPVPLKYIDVTWTTGTTLDVLLE